MIALGQVTASVISSQWIFLLPGLVFVYFAFTWLKNGRDPKPDVNMTQYTPPDGLSPVAARYILTGGSDHKSLAAVLTSLAIKQIIRIEAQQDSYRLSRQHQVKPAALDAEEAIILDLLFVPTGNSKDLTDPQARPSADPRTNPEVAYIRPENSTRNSALVMSIQGSLRKRLADVYFHQNAGWTLTGALISTVGALLIARNTESRGPLIFLTFWFLTFSLIVGFVLIDTVLPALRDAAAGRLALRNLVPTGLGMLLFTAIPGFVLYKIGQLSSWKFTYMLLALLFVNLGWGSLMPSLTEQGRRTLNQILGYKQFLETVERDRLDALNPPNAAPQVLDESLAYAIALDVKEAWGDQLGNAFFASTRSR
jgi:hypothetical protein